MLFLSPVLSAQQSKNKLFSEILNREKQQTISLMKWNKRMFDIFAFKTMETINRLSKSDWSFYFGDLTMPSGATEKIQFDQFKL